MTSILYCYLKPVCKWKLYTLNVSNTVNSLHVTLTLRCDSTTVLGNDIFQKIAILRVLQVFCFSLLCSMKEILLNVILSRSMLDLAVNFCYKLGCNPLLLDIKTSYAR